MTKYSPLAAANWFITHRMFHGGLEHMKLQKLVYCAHGWWLVGKDEPFLNEKPQVWKFGPVFRSLYHTLKPFGHRSIVVPMAPSPFEEPPLIGEPDGELITVLQWVWQRYGHMSSFALSEMTHEKNTAWYRQAKQYSFEVPHGLIIPDEYVRDEFKRIYENEFAPKPTAA